MELKKPMNKSRISVGLCLLIALLASSSMAWGGGRHFGHYNHGFYHGFYHGYAGWPYYRPYWGGGAAFIAPSIGAIVEYLPDGYTTFVVNGVQYYSCGGYYFRSCPSGYVIVSPPGVSAVASPEPSAQSSKSKPSGTQEQASSVSTPQAVPSDGAAVTINIPNASGGFTAVKLTKYKDGYKGPQGEFYPDHPTVDELKALYGK